MDELILSIAGSVSWTFAVECMCDVCVSAADGDVQAVVVCLGPSGITRRKAAAAQVRARSESAGWMALFSNPSHRHIEVADCAEVAPCSRARACVSRLKLDLGVEPRWVSLDS